MWRSFENRLFGLGAVCWGCSNRLQPTSYGELQQERTNHSNGGKARVLNKVPQLVEVVAGLRRVACVASAAAGRDAVGRRV
jgi:hypothetical protein